MKKLNFASLIFGPEKDCSYMEIFLHFFVLRVLGLVFLIFLVTVYDKYNEGNNNTFLDVVAGVSVMGIFFNLLNFIGITYNFIQLRSKAKEKDDSI